MKIPKKKKFFGWGGSGQGVGLGGVCQGGWERRIEAFKKIPKKEIFWGGGGGRGGSGQGGASGGVRVDVYGEVKFL